MSTDTLHWTAVCAVDEILPNTGVCALVEGRHVAVFRVGRDRFFAIDNVDPKSGASVLSRGLVGNLGEQHRGGLAAVQAALRPGYRRLPGAARAVGAELPRARGRHDGAGRAALNRPVAAGRAQSSQRTNVSTAGRGRGGLRCRGVPSVTQHTACSPSARPKASRIRAVCSARPARQAAAPAARLGRQQQVLQRAAERDDALGGRHVRRVGAQVEHGQDQHRAAEGLVAGLVDLFGQGLRVALGAVPRQRPRRARGAPACRARGSATGAAAHGRALAACGGEQRRAAWRRPGRRDQAFRADVLAGVIRVSTRATGRCQGRGARCRRWLRNASSVAAPTGQLAPGSRRNRCRPTDPGADA